VKEDQAEMSADPTPTSLPEENDSPPPSRERVKPPDSLCPHPAWMWGLHTCDDSLPAYGDSTSPLSGNTRRATG